MQYWVYEDRRGDRATIHLAHCTYCNHGAGRSGSRPASGRWHGPFSSRDSAHVAATATHHAVRRCGTC
ncbi:hypothetical protein [Trujillonella humicola]|uniref:hypothetical protein n=1 Tax=Trujillonella humicola TaxID=3383699 RepID=UPI003906C90A